MNKMYILGIVVMLLSYGLGFLTPMLRKKVEKTETKIDDIALEVALGVVQFIDEKLNGKSGESKKQRAIDMVSMKLSQLGINVAKDSLGELVEKAVTLQTVKKVQNDENLVPTGE